jgi:hypothetical protein
MASMIAVSSAAIDKDQTISMAHRVAAATAKLAELALIESLSRGDTSLHEEMIKLVLRNSPADDLGLSVAAKTAAPASPRPEGQDSGRMPEEPEDEIYL